MKKMKAVYVLPLLLVAFLPAFKKQELLQIASSEKTATVTILRGSSVYDTKPNYSYSPAKLTIPRGTTVTWINADMDSHMLAEINNIFFSSLIHPGESYSYTFTKPGRYEYFCVPHPWMKGIIIVE